jgi:WD40 repeat protein
VHLVDLTDPARPAPIGGPLTGAQGALTGVAFTPDGRTLVAAGADRTVRSWDVADPARPAPGAVFTGAAAELLSLATAPDGRLAAGGADGTTYVWSTSDPASPQALTGPAGKVHAVAFSPDGGTLAAGSADTTVRLWNVADPAHPPLGEPLTGPTAWVNTVAFSPDGRRLAFGSSDNGLRVVDLPSRRLVALLPHPGPVTSAAFLDDATLASGEADGVARVWPVPGPGLGGFADSVFALDWSADGRVLAVGPGSKDGTVSLWRVDGKSATPLGTPISNPVGEAAFSGSAALTPDGRTLAVGRTDGSVRVWDVSDPQRPVAVEPPLSGSTGLVEQLTTSPDGATLAVSSDDGTVRLWDLREPTAPRPLRTLTGPTNYVFAAAFSPDGRIVAGASADKRGYLWDLARPGEAPAAVLDGATSYAYSPAFSPDGATLAIGSADKTVRLWDVRRPDHPVPLGAPLTGPTSYVYTVAFSPDGRHLAAASTGGRAWLWDVASPSAPHDPISFDASADPLFTVAFSPDSATLAAAGADRRVHLWTIDPRRAAEALCARVGAPLTPEEWRRHVGDAPYVPPCP